MVGSLHVAPDFVDALTAVIEAGGLADRIAFTGVRTGRALEEEWSRADLLVLPSRTESYGMAVAEALARGIPVLVTGVGGIPEAIPRAGAAMIVPPDDPWALRVVLQQWLGSSRRRGELKAEALAARHEGRSWGCATATVARSLAALAQRGTNRTEAVPS
jgi:glycosyltransferase involved in cell wall biosynthesis